KQKNAGIAVLRCLGCTVSQSFAIYLIQAMALGAVGALAGAAAGVFVQQMVPGVVQDFVPFDLEMQVAWSAVARAMLVGFTVCIVFALLPLLGLRRISPLAVLRSSVEAARAQRDWATMVLVLLILVGLVLFARGQTDRW